MARHTPIAPLRLFDTDHLINEDDRAIRDAVRHFVDNKIKPEVGQWFEDGALPVRELACQELLCVGGRYPYLPSVDLRRGERGAGACAEGEHGPCLQQEESSHRRASAIGRCLHLPASE